MKNLKKILILLLLTFSFSSVFSQENLDSEFTILNQNLLDYKFNQISTQDLNNSAIISQIGNQNLNNNFIIASQSYIQIYQTGNFNSTNIYRVETEVNEFIIQNGNSNYINEMSIGSYNSIENQYIQNGDNNRITSFGSNAIAENLKIQINGNNSSILIINR